MNWRMAVKEVGEILGAYGVSFIARHERSKAFRASLSADGSVIAEHLIEAERGRPGYSRKEGTTKVVVVRAPIAGNVFFTQDMDVTVCTVSGCDDYRPPSIRSYLLAVGIRSLFRRRSAAQHRVRVHKSLVPVSWCLLATQAAKDDFWTFLKPGAGEVVEQSERAGWMTRRIRRFGPFAWYICDNCLKELTSSKEGRHVVDSVFRTLEEWLTSDFAEIEERVISWCQRDAWQSMPDKTQHMDRELHFPALLVPARTHLPFLSTQDVSGEPAAHKAMIDWGRKASIPLEFLRHISSTKKDL